MALIDHFDNVPEAGFSLRVNPAEARRQFNISLVLIASLAVAAFAIGFLLRFDAPPTKRFADDDMRLHQAAEQISQGRQADLRLADPAR
ncbi:MAG: hypothetical protein KGL46_01585 [Hyphomicrobiales bacterium]|nr:hypothetical protein [Hyphomicrobiales bacterium]